MVQEKTYVMCQTGNREYKICTEYINLTTAGHSRAGVSKL